LVFDVENFRKGYRSRLEIIRDLLHVAEGAGDNGSKKTHIMYGANLSYKLLTKYLGEVLDAGLVCAEESCYLLTEKGREFLHVYEGYEKRRRAIKDHIKSLNSGKQTLEEMLRV
jgi:predicted transcriptional regulator